MSLHFNIATEGIKAGHKILSKLGFGFLVEVIVTPVGGGGGIYLPDTTRYNVTVRITRNGKVWESTTEVSPYTLRGLEKIVITFKSIIQLIRDIKISVVSRSINSRDIVVTAFKRKE